MSTTTTTTIRKYHDPDFSKYARPELVKAIGRVADFFGDSLKSVLLPPVALSVLTLLLAYFLPFSSSFVCILFAVVGIVGSLLTGLSFGALQFTYLAQRDVKFILTEMLYLVHNVVGDIAKYARDPSRIPPLSDMVHGVITTVIQPILYGVFEEKFYGSALKWATAPVIHGADKYLTTLVSSMERRFARSSPSKQNRIEKDDEHQHDRKSVHSAMASESYEDETDGIAVKRDRLFEALENVRKRAVPKVDSIASKLIRPLRFATFLFGGGTLVLSTLIYSL